MSRDWNAYFQAHWDKTLLSDVHVHGNTGQGEKEFQCCMEAFAAALDSKPMALEVGLAWLENSRFFYRPPTVSRVQPSVDTLVQHMSVCTQVRHLVAPLVRAQSGLLTQRHIQQRLDKVWGALTEQWMFKSLHWSDTAALQQAIELTDFHGNAHEWAKRAIFANNLPALQLLLTKTDPRYKRSHLLEVAVHACNIDMVRFLLPLSQPNKNDCHVLRLALKTLEESDKQLARVKKRNLSPLMAKELETRYTHTKNMLPAIIDELIPHCNTTLAFFALPPKTAAVLVPHLSKSGWRRLLRARHHNSQLNDLPQVQKRLLEESVAGANANARVRKL